ncbi:MAG: molybdopterin-dependent oxidoreductase [Acidobacteria bacterium]|nr:molybdopterin-dependent oxidoreductase [Acidobacteriota bacterium]
MNRRKLITTGLATAAGATGLAAAARIAETYGLVPPNYVGGLYRAGDTLTYAAHRLITSHALAREFPTSKISKNPFANGKPPRDEAFLQLAANNFADWRLTIDGLVSNPASLSLSDIKAFPARHQITHMACEEGWSFIAEWIGVPLSEILKAAGILPQARYVVYSAHQKNWRSSIDMADALHPQTFVTYAFNGADLPIGHGGPLRLRIARQLGYKNIKFLTRIHVTDSLAKHQRKTPYSWYAGI